MKSKNSLCPTLRKCLRVDNVEACLRALGQCVRHAKSDSEIYEIFLFRIKLQVNFGEGLQALELLEQCLNYYKYIDDAQTVKELIKLKKSIINVKGTN